MAALCAVISIVSCRKDAPADPEGGRPVEGPTIEWASNPDFKPVIIDESLDAFLKISAPAGISSVLVKVESSLLEPVLAMMKIPSEFDLVNDTEVAAILGGLVGDALPFGDDLLGKTEVSIDITSLVQMISLIATESGDHSFILTVKDSNGETVQKTCTFSYVYVKPTGYVEVSDIDLWLNTAAVSVTTENASSVSVWFGEKDGSLSEIEAVDGAYRIEPEYSSESNDSGLTVYVPVKGTGVYAGKTYVVELRDGETVLDTEEFTTASGDVIPNGDMSAWSTKTSLPYPNAEGESFWDSGNNSFSTLCEESDGAAHLKANLVLSAIFAPGNMYTGDFNMSGFSGTASFGKKFDWTARPAALKVSYRANVGTIDKEGASDPLKGSLSGKADTTRVYAVVVDWTAQHSVVSGIGTPSGMWDPATATSLDEGAILGYAMLDITETQADFKDVEVPFVWYDTESKPASDNYSIVISCATSKRGDYLTGCSTNELWIDNFGFAY